MKYCIIIPDGMADTPAERLRDRTPLEAARTPHMDRAAKRGTLGLVNTVPHRLKPGSDVAIMSVFGYDPLKYYTGRAPLEAADLGIDMGPEDWAFRCNLVTVSEDLMADYCAGHISTKEAALLVETLNEKIAREDVEFHTGTGYRHLMLYTGEQEFDVSTTPPHDIMGDPVIRHLPRGDGSDLLVDLMEGSAEVLPEHDVNAVRVDLQQNPANMIWLWGQGRKAPFDSFSDRFGVNGAAISAVNLVRGIARLIGWDIVKVPGATGYLDTDYAAKGRYAVDALRSYDLVAVHIEAPDEAGHNGDLQAKIKAIEQVDSDIVGPVLSEAESSGDIRVLIMPDHYTPCAKRTHARGPVPFALWGPDEADPSGLTLSEENAAKTGVKVDKGHQLIEKLLGRELD